MGTSIDASKSTDIHLSSMKEDSDFKIREKRPVKELIREALKKEKLMLILVVAVLLGFLFGTVLNPTIRALHPYTRENVLILVGFPGEIFLRSLKLIILPLIFSSLVTGMAALDKKSAGRVSFLGIIYYLVTTFAAVILGIILVVSIQPGSQLGASVHKAASKDVRTLDVILDIIRNVFPENIVAATFTQTKTDSYRKYTSKNETVQLPPDWDNMTRANQEKYIADHHIIKISGGSATKNVTTFEVFPKKPSSHNGMNMIGIISFSIVFGVLLGRLGERGNELLNCLGAVSEIMTVMVDLVMLISPIGVASLIIGQFWKMTDIGAAFSSLALYMITVIVGLLIHMMLTLNLMYFAITRKNPLVYLKNLSKACITAFSTASSAATIPVTLTCLERYNQIRPKVARFMVPVGATINMDGTALYEAVAAIFIAQSTNVSLSFGQICLTSITATIASVGAAGVPQGGLVTIVMVLQVLGLPSESLGLILSVDWLLDRFRTTVNVIGDSYGAGIVDHLLASEVDS